MRAGDKSLMLRTDSHRKEDDRSFGVLLESRIEEGPRYLHNHAALLCPYFRRKLCSNIKHIFRYPNELHSDMAITRKVGLKSCFNCFICTQMHKLSCAAVNMPFVAQSRLWKNSNTMHAFVLPSIRTLTTNIASTTIYLARLDDLDDSVSIHKHRAALRQQGNSMHFITGLYNNLVVLEKALGHGI